MSSIDLGNATLVPDAPLVAGSYSTVTFTYTAGHPIDDSGYLKIAFRSVSDFGPPQFGRPDQPNYCSLSTNGNCRLVPRWDEKGHIRPWSRALFIQITGGFLDRGERIAVTFGDRSGGSPGWLVQTFRQRGFTFRTLVDSIASYRFKLLPTSPAVPIQAGPPDHGVCIAPSRAAAGRPIAYSLRIEDRWGNPTGEPLALEHPGFQEPGCYTLRGECPETGLSAVSNPVEVAAASSEHPPCGKEYKPFWADFHGQSEETVGTGSIEEYFTYARDYARLDICAHQGNDFQVTDAFWRKINQTTERFYQPGSFVTFPGYEWSGNTPVGGDRNVYFASEGGSISRSCRELISGGKSRHPDSPTAEALFRTLKRHSEQGPSAFAFAHVGGRYADLTIHDEQIEVAVEVHSAWGTFEWLVEEALRRGYRIGIVANSDGHKCRPGSSYPGAGEFGSLGGLTCVLAERLDRESVLSAIRARRFYATTGNRPLISMLVERANGQRVSMGQSLALSGDATEALKLSARIAPTAPIERVEVRSEQKVLAVLRPYTKSDLGRRIKVLWSGAEVPGRARLVRWDGKLELRGNRILSAEPVNFWNPLQPLRRRGGSLSWRSVTTGGVAGAIIETEEMREGRISFQTFQGSGTCELAEIGIEPRLWDFGGLRKRIEIYRLPEKAVAEPFSFGLTLEHGGGVKPLGDSRAIYLCVIQEDGHMAWTSPIYLLP